MTDVRALDAPVRISELPVATFVVLGNVFPIVQDGVTKQADIGLVSGATNALLTFNNLSDVASAESSRSNLGVAIGVDVQAYSLNLTTYAGIAPSPSVQSILAAPDYSAIQTLLGASPFFKTLWDDPDAATFRASIGAASGGGGTGDMLSSNNLSDVASVPTSRINLGLQIGVNVQAYSPNLTTYAGIAPSANVQSILSSADYAAMLAQLALPITTQAGTSYAALLTDANSYIRFTSASAVAFTIPANVTVAFPVNTVIIAEQAGAGLMTWTAAAGVTLNSRSGALTSGGQYAVSQVKKVGTNTWTVIGDVA